MKCVRGFFKKPHVKGAEYPYVKAVLVANNEKVGLVEFLVDTGAGVTTLSYGDSLKTDLIKNVDKNKCIETLGIGGAEKACPPKQHPTIVLEDVENPDIRVVAPADDPTFLIPQKPRLRGRAYYQGVARPSILGWNVLQYSKLTVDYIKQERGVMLR